MRQRPQDSEKAITSFAYRVLRRLKAAGAHTFDLDDVKQELWLAWAKACDEFDPNLGVKFSTFLYRGMRMHINRWVENNVDRRHDEVIAYSVDASFDTDGEGSGTLADVLPSDDPIQDVNLEHESSFRHALTMLSPRAAQFVTLLKDQPIELLEQVRLMEVKSEYARERGIVSPVARRLTSSMIFDLMAAGRTERAKIMTEVEKVGALLAQ